MVNWKCRIGWHKPRHDPIYELSPPPSYNTFIIRCERCKKILKQVSQQMTIIEDNENGILEM